MKSKKISTESGQQPPRPGIFKKNMLRYFVLLVAGLLVCLCVYGIYFTSRLYTQSREAAVASANSRLLAFSNSCFQLLTDLGFAGRLASISYEADGFVDRSLLGKKGLYAYLYDADTDALKPILKEKTSNPWGPTALIDDLKNNFLSLQSGPIEYPFLKLGDSLDFAYSVMPAADAQEQFIVVVETDLEALSELLNDPLYQNSELFIKGKLQNIVYSHGITAQGLPSWESSFLKTAFQNNLFASTTALVPAQDFFMFSSFHQHDSISFLGLIPQENIYSAFTADFILALVVTGFVAAICILFLLRFYHDIYVPILKIEQVVNGFSDGSPQFELQLSADNQFYGFSQQINFIVRHVHDILDREYNESLLRKQAQIDALQSQINPHFLYNTFDSMRGQALAQGATDVASMLKSLSSLFRYTISNNMSIVTLEEEMTNTDDYLHIQQYRFHNKFRITKEIAPDCIPEILHCKMPKLTLQPIVENSLVHGLEPKSGVGALTIRAYLTDNCLIIEVEDDGIGMSVKRLAELNQKLRNDAEAADKRIPHAQSGPRHTSIGLVNTNARIMLLYGPQYGLHIYSIENMGTTVRITLPIIK